MAKVEEYKHRELCEGVASAPDWERPGLSERGRRVARAVAEALLCDDRGDGLVAPAEMCERSVDGLDRSLGACSSTVRVGLRALLWLVEWLPLVVEGRAARASHLPLRARAAYLEALETSSFPLFNMLLVAVKIPLTIAAYEEGEALRQTGFDRASLAERRGKLPILQRLDTAAGRAPAATGGAGAGAPLATGGRS
ncbi:MAG: hypothetical protein IT373_00605 [Polyangiaceae bacterium]|nr:hypothetical protein [Polyangiaceae bacterium]